jgi:hypothetical protein
MNRYVVLLRHCLLTCSKSSTSKIRVYKSKIFYINNWNWFESPKTNTFLKVDGGNSSCSKSATWKCNDCCFSFQAIELLRHHWPSRLQWRDWIPVEVDVVKSFTYSVLIFFNSIIMTIKPKVSKLNLRVSLGGQQNLKGQRLISSLILIG